MKTVWLALALTLAASLAQSARASSDLTKKSAHCTVASGACIIPVRK